MTFQFSSLRALATSLLLAAVTAGSAYAGAWTSVGSCGTLDETNSGSAAFTGAQFSYKTGAASINQIQARYNVTNTAGVDNPAWNTLELGNFDNYAAAGTFVRATLYKVAPCSGDSSAICTVTSTNAAAKKCDICQFAGGLNFNLYLYYIDVIIDRTVGGAAAELPVCNTLRLY